MPPVSLASPWARFLSQYPSSLGLEVTRTFLTGVVRVAKVVLDDPVVAEGRGDDQFLVGSGDAELPSLRQLQLRPELLQAVIGQGGIDDLAPGLHHPRCAVWVLDDEDGFAS